MRKIVVGIISTSLLGCAMGHRDPVEIKQTLNQSINESNSRVLDELPASVQDDLMPELGNDGFDNSDKTLKRFRIQANQVEARAFFASLVKGTEFSVAVHPHVSGLITLNVSDVTLDDILSVVQDMYGYDVVKTGKVIQVYPAGLRTVTIPVDYIQFQRSGRSLTSIVTSSVTSRGSSGSNSSSKSNSSSSDSSSNSSGSSQDSSTTASGGTRIDTVTESNFWPLLQQAVSRLIGSGDGQSVVVTPQASVITVRAYPDEIREVRQFLGVSQQRMQRQVILETKILEVTLSDGYQQGINWSRMFTSSGTQYQISSGSISKDGSGNILTETLPGLNAIGSLLGGQSNMVVSGGSFEAVLSFMSTQGDLNVLSSPRVTAANNQKAVIKVGSDEYYVTAMSSVAGSGDSANVAPEVTLTPFFSGISLDVTPQIDDNGNVFLHVHPAVIEVETDVKNLNLGGGFANVSLPLAKSSIRESDSVIRARDGDVVVIGGLMKSNTIDRVSKVPFLGDIPALGHLFRNTNKLTQKTELVILLKPTVVGVNTWQKELERSRDLLQEWFPE
ncbi:pilus (MSHA type) biogenesis protein MshL [Vibrio navarrensis]|uniref:pilus (MSHA type) biogenesis protein MshL n=1 Tax=Vibrio navarrensis TaxID=29495 RepID=UPI0018698C7E|nr:pilus (MSHA type) biogenesis protein MshL [Vibrio navarrensis]MBE4608064.1 pilus (MSHA type) biogenesis protein MshL [Vibrio navarrensis]MBE4612710.1 pilus (MSHA type) biogenesis protein MshL [Vibrio navarrensis]